MSVRRLAEVQPPSFAFTPENVDWAKTQIAKYPEGREASAVISLLWRAQKQNDYWLPKPAIEEVARLLRMPYIRVLEIATFYTMFNLAPVGRFFIQMCGTTPCVLRGSDALKQVLERRIGPQRTVTQDGLFSWLEVECLGACCNAPMVQINDDYYEDLTAESLERLMDDLAAGRPVKIGPQNGRRTSEPEGGLTSLITLYGRDGRSGPGCVDAAPSNGASSNEATSNGAPAAREPSAAPTPPEPASARREQEAKESTGYPPKSEDTGVARTDPPQTGGPHPATENGSNPASDAPGAKDV
jgi:NADH-quinone oxidoreductase subunit E